MYVMEYYSVIFQKNEKNEIAICDNMDGYKEYYAKWNN